MIHYPFALYDPAAGPASYDFEKLQDYPGGYAPVHQPYALVQQIPHPSTLSGDAVFHVFPI